MNIYRLLGDGTHDVGILLFLYLVYKKGNASGISKKTQQIYLLVFVSRYLDLFTFFYSWYNSIVKVFYICGTTAILFGLSYVEPAKSTYSDTQDTAQIWKIVVPPLVLAFFVCSLGMGVVNIYEDEMEVHFDRVDLLEFLWTFSICLEAVAIIPQLIIYRRNRNLQSELRLAIGCHGAYRFLYILNWIYRAFTEPNYRHHYLVYLGGVVQVLIYCDFFGYESRLLCSTMTELQRQSQSSSATGSPTESFEQEASAPLLDSSTGDEETELPARPIAWTVKTDATAESSSACSTDNVHLQVV